MRVVVPTCMLGIALLGAAPLRCALAQDSASSSTSIPSPASQSTQDKINASFSLLLRSEFDKARALAEEALHEAQAQSDYVNEGEALCTLGRIATATGHLKESRGYYDQSWAIFEKHPSPLWIARLHMNYGTLFELEGNKDASRREFQQALAGFDAIGDVVSKVLVMEALGADPAELVTTARTAKDRNLEAGLLHSWGDGLFTQGKYVEAQEKIEEAGKIYKEIGSNASYARVLTSLGRIQRAHGRVRDAIPYYEQALEIQRRTGDRVGQVQSLNAIAVSNGILEEESKAKEYFQEALKVAEQTGSPRIVDFVKGGLVSAEMGLGEFDKAEENLKAIISRNVANNLSYRYSDLAQIYIATHRYSEALEASRAALDLARKEDPEGLPQFLAGCANAYRLTHQIPQAETELDEAVRLIEEKRRHTVPADFMKRGFTDQYREIYSAAIALDLQRGDAAKAFELAESARARAFLDLLATRDLKLKQKDDPLIAELQRQQSSSDDSDTKDASTEGLSGLLFRGGSHHLPDSGKRARVSEPQLLSSVSAQPPTLDEITNTVRKLGTTLVSFWVTDDATFIWTLGQSGVIHSERVDVRRKHLTELIRATTNISATESGPSLPARGGSVTLPSSTTKAWRELYTLLIDPIHDVLPRTGRLTIVPNGPLNGLSFAGLESPSGRYLVEDYEIHYSPSASLLSVQGGLETAHNGSARQFLLVADPSSPSSSREKPLPPLPGAREEVTSIAKQLNGREVTLMLGPNATEAKFRSALRGKDVVHLSTHAIINPEAPFDSYLALAGSGKRSDDDGRLTAQEIYGLELQSDLVVLSACSTGTDSVSVDNDGIAHLARAFFYAGSSSLMVTLWDVEDEASSQLLSHFYADWLHHETKTAALRRAQIKMIHELRAGHVQAHTALGPVTLPENPYFWAGFVLLGRP